MRPYNALNTELRTSAQFKLDIKFFKLMNNLMMKLAH